MKNDIYTPLERYLKNYADILVNFGLGNGKGITKGDTVLVIIAESARPLLVELRKAITKAGGNVILRYIPDDEARYSFSKDFYRLATDAQLRYAPLNVFRGLVEDADHVITILSDDPQQLKGVDAKKLNTHTSALTKLRSYYIEKENAGKLTWTLALYATPSFAREAGLSTKEYWNQIIKACFLDKKNPIGEWKKVHKQMNEYRKKLNALTIEKVHVQGRDVDLWVTIGKKRQWKSGGGSNIPSFEIFTSPDWRGTEGWIRFNQPLYYLGNKISGIELWFKKGLVVKSRARTNQALLHAMINEKNANKIGEFSLTDARFSHITKFMAHTLYDENMGGTEGNTHIALGNAYRDCYSGKVSSLTESDWKRLGFNTSSVHTDIISTAPRTVTAYPAKGDARVIYHNGNFIL